MNHITPRPRLLAIDLDGTLLDHQGKISTPNAMLLSEAVNSQVEVVPVSARAVFGIQFALRGLDCYCRLIAFNGAYVFDHAADQVMLDLRIGPDQVLEILNLVKKHGLYAGYYLGNEFYAEVDGESARLEGRFQGRLPQFVPDLREFVPRGANKLIILETRDLEKLRQFNEEANLTLTGLNMPYSSYCSIEITRQDVSKGSGLRFLAEQLGIQPDEVMAIGDNYNDISMLSYAGVSIAVGNAPAEVRAAANYVVAPCEADGVAEAISRFIFQRDWPEARVNGTRM